MEKRLEKDRVRFCPRVTEMTFCTSEGPAETTELRGAAGAEFTLSPCALMLLANELISCLLLCLMGK